MNPPLEDRGGLPASPSSDPFGLPLARAVFESATEGLLVLAADGTVLAVNRALCALYAIDAADMVGRHHSAFTQHLEICRFGERVAPDDWVTVRALQGERATGVLQEIRILQSGREFVSRCGAVPHFEGEQLVAVTVTVEDVTDDWTARRTLEEQAARHASLLEAESAVTDADGACVEIQEGDEMVYEAGVGIAAPFVGLRLAAGSSLSGRTVREGVTARCDDCESDERVDRDACRRIGVRSMALVPLRYDERSFGVLKVMSSTPSAFSEWDLQCLGLLGGFLGASIGRARTATALEREEARFRAIFDNAAVGMLEIDPRSYGILRVNPAAVHLFGYSEDELLGRSPFELAHPEDVGVGKEGIDRIGDGDAGVFEFERRYVQKGGSVVWMLVRVTQIPGGELGPARNLAVMTDVTERKRAEEALREANENLERRVEERTEELTRANRDLDQFAYSVAHDLRAPLRNIVATSRMLLEDAAGRLDAAEFRLLERQAASGVRLAQIVDDLLGFARLAQAEPRRVPFDLTALAKRTAEQVRTTRGSECEVEAREGMEAVGDPSLVGYVLTNLLDNACKFSPQGGRVYVGEEGGAFFVRDQGVGFDMAHAGKLFVAFERLVGQRQFEGTGVGLANVRRIVEKHGGRVWAESEPGRGATFWFTLAE